MRVFKMNETDTVVAESLEKAIEYQNTICKSDTNEAEEITDLENNYCYYGLEDHPDGLSEKEITDARISFKNLIDKHWDGEPMHFTTDIE